jgi:exodeoxyribonuclease III
LYKNSCDILALQELKLSAADNAILASQLLKHGYYYVYNAQKQYNGVGIISKYALSNVQCYDINVAVDREELECCTNMNTQKRIIAATVQDIRIISIYAINGMSYRSPQYFYKLAWYQLLCSYLAETLQSIHDVIILGDFNIAPAVIDTYSATVWHEHCLISSQAERELFQQLCSLGFTDSWRYIHPAAQEFTWWDYRQAAFARNLGLRIDHILVSNNLLNSISACYIDQLPRKLIQPSDHTPVILELTHNGKLAT